MFRLCKKKKRNEEKTFKKNKYQYNCLESSDGNNFTE